MYRQQRSPPRFDGRSNRKGKRAVDERVSKIRLYLRLLFTFFLEFSGIITCSNPRCTSQNELVCCGVLSGNRNFEGRIHPNTRANYLASPLLVIAYAIAGTVDIDFEKEPLGKLFLWQISCTFIYSEDTGKRSFF